MQRMRNIYKNLRNNQEVFVELYQEGKTDELNERVDDLADELMMDDATYHDLIQRLTSVRSSRGPNREEIEGSIRDDIRALRAKYRQVVTVELNLPDEVRLGTLEHAAVQVKELLQERGFDGQSPKEALQLLGVAIPQENGKTIYQFPTELMPPEVITKWESYLSSVIADYQAATRVSEGRGLPQEAEETDRARKYAHDIVTADVHRILGLEGMQGWTLPDTRRLLASIRDNTLPDDTSLNSDSAKKFLAEHHSLVTACGRLAERAH